MIKIGFIKYSNCFPIYYPFWNGTFAFDGCQVSEDVPAGLNKACRAGELDVSAVSSIEYAGAPDNYLIVDGLSLNSFGYVKSVILVSRHKLEDLDKKRIWLTASSATSHNLIKIILADHYKVRPVYEVFSQQREDMDTYLLIGDSTLGGNNPPGWYVYDIGKLWADIYKLPVIFALWVVNRKSLDHDTEGLVEVISSLKKSYSYTKDNWGKFLVDARKRYSGLSVDLEEYYSGLSYDFDADKRKACEFFLERSAALGLAAGCDKLNMLSDHIK